MKIVLKHNRLRRKRIRKARKLAAWLNSINQGSSALEGQSVSERRLRKCETLMTHRILKKPARLMREIGKDEK